MIFSSIMANFCPTFFEWKLEFRRRKIVWFYFFLKENSIWMIKLITDAVPWASGKGNVIKWSLVSRGVADEAFRIEAVWMGEDIRVALHAENENGHDAVLGQSNVGIYRKWHANVHKCSEKPQERYRICNSLMPHNGYHQKRDCINNGTS